MFAGAAATVYLVCRQVAQIQDTASTNSRETETLDRELRAEMAAIPGARTEGTSS